MCSLQLHRPNRPPSFALVLREDLSRLVVLAPSVHPSSRLPLIVQHLLVVPGVPPTLLSSISCSYTRPVYGVQCLLGFLLLVPRSPSGSWLHLFYSFGPSYSFDPCLLSPGSPVSWLLCSRSDVSSMGAPHGPVFLPSWACVCTYARVHVCTYSSSCLLGLCVYAHYTLQSFFHPLLLISS